MKVVVVDQHRVVVVLEIANRGDISGVVERLRGPDGTRGVQRQELNTQPDLRGLVGAWFGANLREIYPEPVDCMPAGPVLELRGGIE